MLQGCEQSHRETQGVIWTPLVAEKGDKTGELLPHCRSDEGPQFPTQIWGVGLSVLCG